MLDAHSTVALRVEAKSLMLYTCKVLPNVSLRDAGPMAWDLSWRADPAFSQVNGSAFSYVPQCTDSDARPTKSAEVKLERAASGLHVARHTWLRVDQFKAMATGPGFHTQPDFTARRRLRSAKEHR